MRKKSIAELREQEVVRLAEYRSADPSDADICEARRLMNSFYRLCGLCERNLYLANDDRTHNLKSTKKSEEREERWRDRLNAEFESFAGLRLVYCGYMPSIGVVHKPGGGFSEKITRWFYE